jgi:photosystem II stability/assembly factor-like uncharacterized protein
MKTFHRLLTFIVLGLVLSFGSAIQRNQAAENGIIPYYLPMALREDEMLQSLGPEGGSIVVMELDPNNTNVLYAGTWGSGMYKSVDAGYTWQIINQGLPYLYINSLAIDPQNPAILYAGTYEHGVYKTTDGGDTWAATGPGLSPIPIVYTIAVDPVTPNVVYVGTRNQQEGPPWGGGLYKSTDGGGTWKKSKLGLTEEWVYDITIDPATHTTIYAASHSKGVFKSVDSAAYWEPINNGITDLSTRSIVIDPTNPDIVYVGTWHYGGVFKTVNGGDSWKPAASGLYHKIYSLNMDPKNPNIIYAGTYRKGIMVTETAGASWHNTGLFPDLVYNVMIDPIDHNQLYAGTMGAGFYISSNRGESWVGSNAGFRATTITGLAADWSTPLAEADSIADSETITNTGVDAIYTSIYGGGIYKTSDLGQSWQGISNGLAEPWVSVLAMSRTDPQTLYAGTDTAGFYITTDGGATWVANNNGLPAPVIAAAAAEDGWIDPTLRPDRFDRAFFEGAPDVLPSAEAATKIVSILAIGVNSFDPLKLYIGTDGQGVFRSQNGGVRWYPTNLKIHKVYAILSDPFTPGIIYAGCDGASNTLYRSIDDGETWKLSNMGLAGLSIYALAADPAIPGTVFAGSNQGVFKTTDSGQTWVSVGLPGIMVTALGVSPASPGKIFAGTYYGLYISEDFGATWKQMNNGLVNAEITSVVMDPTGSPEINLVGTHAGGVYSQGYTFPADK